MVSLMIQQLYREILAVADENDGKLKNRHFTGYVENVARNLLE